MNEAPSISVVLTIRNEAKFIEECLSAVMDQDYPKDRIEVVVVDGMSDDGTRELLKTIEAREACVKVINNPGRIFPTGVNLGIREARGELIMILGGHAVLPPNYLRECVRCLLSEKVDCVGGAVDSVGVGRTAEGIALAMSSRFGVGGSGFRTQGPESPPIPTDTVPFGVFRRAVFERIGLFHEAMVRHQDYELNYRLRRTGGKILLLPWLRVRYYVRSGPKSLARQYWQYGIWKGRFLRAHPESIKPRHLVPPIFVGTLVACALASALFKPALALGALLAAVYVVFLICVSASLSARNCWRQAPLITLALALIHLTWGTGVWLGLLRGRVIGPPPALVAYRATGSAVSFG